MDGTLYHLPISPWSKKARCALAHHGLEPERVAYTPLLGEIPLRIRLGRYRGRLSVPIWLTPDGDQVHGSFEIAERADRHGKGIPLVPAEHTSTIAEWSARSERLMNASRARAMLRTLESGEAISETVPASARALPAWVQRRSIELFCAKYGIRNADYAAHGDIVRSELDTLVRAVEATTYLVANTFSYADIAMACALFVLEPPADIPLGPAMRRIWKDPDFAGQHGALLQWRERLEQAHPLAA